jgi:hypothetical protein
MTTATPFAGMAIKGRQTHHDQIDMDGRRQLGLGRCE